VLVCAAVVLAVAGLAGAALLYARGPARADRLAARTPALHRLLSGGYFFDELYDLLIGRPLEWLSARVLLRIGDQWLIDGALHGLAALAQRTAGRLSQVQAGGLQRYLLLAGLGVLACVAWVWRHV
jgi:NADH-quinone oxidoreductase subunit L